MKANIDGVLNKTTIGRGVALESNTSRILKPLQDPLSPDLADFQSRYVEFDKLQSLRLAYNDFKTFITNDVLLDGGVSFSSDTTRMVFDGDDDAADSAVSRTINVLSINLDSNYYSLAITDTNGEYIIPIAGSYWTEATNAISDVLDSQGIYSLTYDENSGDLTLTNKQGISSIRYLAIHAHPTVSITVDTMEDEEEKPYFEFSDPIMDAVLIGNPTAPTMPLEDDSDAIATTKFVHAVAAGGVVYKGTFDASAGNYNALSTSRVGYLYYVDGDGTIGDIEWKVGDYLLVNADGATSVTKIDNTESTDLVRLAAVQTLTNKTLVSPTFTGTPTTPTAPANSNNSQVASTEYVDTAISNFKIDVDDKPTQGSTNAVSSGGTFDALELKQDKLSAGDNISISANNVISASFNSYKGTWNAATDYKEGEIVSYNLNSASRAITNTGAIQLFIATQDSTGEEPSFTSTYWKNFDTEKVNVNSTTEDEDLNLLAAPLNSGLDTDIYATDGKSPTINLNTGLLKVPGGIDNYYNKKEVDDKIDAKDSLPEQTGHANEFLGTNGTDASWTALPEATTEKSGVVKLATADELTAGTSTTSVISVKDLEDKLATKQDVLTQSSDTYGKYWQSTSSGGAWNSVAVIRTWDD